LNFDCVYLQSASSSNVIIGKEYLGTLEERLRVAEANIKALQANQTNQSRPSRQLRFDDEEEGGRENGIEIPERIRPERQRNGGMEVNSDDVQDFSSLEDETDGMGAIVFSAEEDCAFFGKYIPSHRRLSSYIQGHPQILLLRVIYLVRWHK
jgi:hypothetical protein